MTILLIGIATTICVVYAMVYYDASDEENQEIPDFKTQSLTKGYKAKEKDCDCAKKETEKSQISE
jgi:hypothetical protein